MTSGASFVVYSIDIGSDPERSCLSVIVAFETELSCLASQDMESRFPVSLITSTVSSLFILVDWRLP